jgi:hypothetical protein
MSTEKTAVDIIEDARRANSQLVERMQCEIRSENFTDKQLINRWGDDELTNAIISDHRIPWAV